MNEKWAKMTKKQAKMGDKTSILIQGGKSGKTRFSPRKV
jgi:hypothetical protein